MWKTSPQNIRGYTDVFLQRGWEEGIRDGQLSVVVTQRGAAGKLVNAGVYDGEHQVDSGRVTVARRLVVETDVRRQRRSQRLESLVPARLTVARAARVVQRAA